MDYDMDYDSSEMYFNRFGQPVSMKEWATNFSKIEHRRIALTYPTPDVNISTVLLGLNHRFMSDGPPLIFETMIFGGPHDQHQERYSTEAEAIKRHAEIDANLRAGLDL